MKATVDAYTGEVTIYAWDTEDPILQTWDKIFPGTITSADEMSDDLIAHIRYPADLFKVQRQILETYHVTDAGTFYSAQRRVGHPEGPDPAGASAQAQPPYYLTMQVPGHRRPGVHAVLDVHPAHRSGDAAQSVLTGYLAVNSDPGPDYGKLTLLTLPKSDTVPGPGQAQNQFTSDADVANELNILAQGDTDVIRGNLLTLPVGGGLLYVQPVYVQSNGETSYPLLRKILVAFGDKIAYEDTLDAALDSLFGGDSGADAGDGDVPIDPTDPTDPTIRPTHRPDDPRPGHRRSTRPPSPQRSPTTRTR